MTVRAIEASRVADHPAKMRESTENRRDGDALKEECAADILGTK